jgi:hypothetical protein
LHADSQFDSAVLNARNEKQAYLNVRGRRSAQFAGRGSHRRAGGHTAIAAGADASTNTAVIERISERVGNGERARRPADLKRSFGWPNGEEEEHAHPDVKRFAAAGLARAEGGLKRSFAWTDDEENDGGCTKRLSVVRASSPAGKPRACSTPLREEGECRATTSDDKVELDYDENY